MITRWWWPGVTCPCSLWYYVRESLCFYQNICVPARLHWPGSYCVKSGSVPACTRWPSSYCVQSRSVRPVVTFPLYWILLGKRILFVHDLKYLCLSMTTLTWQLLSTIWVSQACSHLPLVCTYYYSILGKKILLFLDPKYLGLCMTTLTWQLLSTIWVSYKYCPGTAVISSLWFFPKP